MSDSIKWARKAIVYFCKNYTIDGYDLMPHLKTALKNNTSGWLTCEGSWFETAPGYDFWDCLFYLETGTLMTNQKTQCRSWNKKEREVINNMPEV